MQFIGIECKSSTSSYHCVVSHINCSSKIWNNTLGCRISDFFYILYYKLSLKANINKDQF